MTTEQKAKAYDEALDRMKHVVIVPKNEKALQALKETIFPELAESEDERIRKELIEFIKRSVDKHFMREDFHQAKTSEWITYLEKQKKQFESGSGLYYYDGEKLYFIGDPSTEENPYDFAMSQQEEQKPTESAEDIYKKMKDARKEAGKPYLFHDPLYYTPYYPPCFHGGMCTNPFRDCINCPRTGEYTSISTTSGTYKKEN